MIKKIFKLILFVMHTIGVCVSVFFIVLFSKATFLGIKDIYFQLFIHRPVRESVINDIYLVLAALFILITSAGYLFCLLRKMFRSWITFSLFILLIIESYFLHQVFNAGFN